MKLKQRISQDYDFGLQPGLEKGEIYKPVGNCPAHKSVLTYGHPKDQRKIEKLTLSINMTQLHAWPQTQASRLVPESFFALYGAKNLYCPMIPLEVDPKECHYSPWYQIADNTANSSLNNFANSNMLLDRNTSNEPTGCLQNYIYYTTKFK